ncbi:hypothetical protein ACROYT_G014859 [Oculina patagonica]
MTIIATVTSNLLWWNKEEIKEDDLLLEKVQLQLQEEQTMFVKIKDLKSMEREAAFLKLEVLEIVPGVKKEGKHEELGRGGDIQVYQLCAKPKQKRAYVKNCHALWQKENKLSKPQRVYDWNKIIRNKCSSAARKAKYT